MTDKVRWHFPPAEAFLGEGVSLRDQEEVIEREISELRLENAIAPLGSAAFAQHGARVAEEAWDVVHATETHLHLLERHGVDVAAALRAVEDKNRKRGYYGADVGSCEGCSRVATTTDVEGVPLCGACADETLSMDLYELVRGLAVAGYKLLAVMEREGLCDPCGGPIPEFDVANELMDAIHSAQASIPALARICRKCGCTEDRACEEGCHWVEPDLCSACAGEVA